MDEIYKVVDSMSDLRLVGYGTQSEHYNLQQYASFAGPDVAVAAKEIKAFVRLTDDVRKFDLLVAEGSDVDGRRIDLYVSSKNVDLPDHELLRPAELGLEGNITVSKFQHSDALAFRDKDSGRVLIVVGTAYRQSGAAFPVFEVDVGD